MLALASVPTSCPPKARHAPRAGEAYQDALGRWVSEGRCALQDYRRSFRNRELLADELDVSPQYVGMLLAGTRLPSVQMTARLWLVAKIPGHAWGLAPTPTSNETVSCSNLVSDGSKTEIEGANQMPTDSNPTGPGETGYVPMGPDSRPPTPNYGPAGTIPTKAPAAEELRKQFREAVPEQLRGLTDPPKGGTPTAAPIKQEGNNT